MCSLRATFFAFFIFAFVSSLQVNGNELVYRTPSGKLSVIEVETDHCFADVMERIHAEINTDLNLNQINEADFSSGKGHTLEYLMDFMATNQGDVASPKGEYKRDYNAPLRSEEQKGISYIIETLGNSSLVSLAKSKSSLERIGDDLEHIHPLQFLGYIFSSEKLKASFHNMRSRSWVWGKFFKGIRTSLEDEHNKHNLMQFMKDFCKRIGVNEKKIHPHAEQKRWKEFLDALFAEVPRSGNYDRYDM